MTGLFIAVLLGQNLWAKTYGGPMTEEARSITQTTDGGYVVAGLTYSFGAGYYDCFVLKLNPDGSLAWARTYGGTSSDKAFSITRTTDGGYAVAGAIDRVSGSDFLILKLNPDGSLAWARTYGETNDSELAWSITQTADGGYAVTGRRGGDCLILKLNPDGSLAWARTYGSTGWDDARSIIQTSDGGYAVAGATDGFLSVLKLNPDGSFDWGRTYRGTASDWPNSIIQTTDGGYVVAGVTYSFGAGYYDCFVLKLNPDGSL
ncbi:MAG: hypothetical protein ABIM59_05095, partial [candidate division WOR-3 bacterium]